MQNSVVNICCGETRGSAFYVSCDMLLTAYHVVSETSTGEEIMLVADSSCKMRIVEKWEEFDLALLRSNKKLSQNDYKLYAHHLKCGEVYETYGYPDLASTEGLLLTCRVAQRMNGTEPADIRLSIKDYMTTYRYNGLSGSPVFDSRKNVIVGVVIEQEGGDIRMVSVNKFHHVIVKYFTKILSDELPTDIPEGIKVELEHVIPNYESWNALEDVISEDSSWILLHGAPGSGKTTLLSMFSPLENGSLQVLGRYYLKVPNDVQSTAQRCSQRSLLEWLESVYVNHTNSEIAQMNEEERLRSVGMWINQLSTRLNIEKKIGLLIIDGLDELGENISSFLEVINVGLPNNIKIILSCTSVKILPPFMIEKLPTSCRVEMRPLSMATRERYVKKRCEAHLKDSEYLLAIAEKSEGHPLYMNYLCGYVNNSFTKETPVHEIETWLQSLPIISGRIESYYSAIWSSICPSSDTMEVLSILSQLRTSVSEDQLVQMMQKDSRMAFESAKRSIIHLLKYSDKKKTYEIYHSSFKIYIEQNIPEFIRQEKNEQIVAYCDTNAGTRYAIEHKLYHILKGKFPHRAIAMCHQEWADACAKEHVNPDLMLQDIKACLSYSIDNLETLDIVRLMLLGQRIEYRYDMLFAQNAALLTEICIRRGNVKEALNYVIRDQTLLLSLPEALSILFLLSQAKDYSSARKLYDVLDAKCIRESEAKTNNGIDLFPLLIKGEAMAIMAPLAKSHTAAFHSFCDWLSRVNQKMEEHEDDGAMVFRNVRIEIMSWWVSTFIRNGVNVPFEESIKQQGLNWNKELMIMIAQTLLTLNKQIKIAGKLYLNNALQDCISQLEVMYDKHKEESFDTQQLLCLIESVIHKTNRVDMVRDWISQLGEQCPSWNIRENNGVDVNKANVTANFQYWRNRGYCDEVLSLPILLVNNWEERLMSITQRIAYLIGFLYQQKAKGDVAKYYSCVTTMLKDINFGFQDRMVWDRSYQIPEMIVPFLYEELTVLYRDVYLTHVRDMVDELESAAEEQLSLYREGYKEILLRVATILAADKNLIIESKRVIDILYEFTLYAEQNREERTNYLLEIIKLYEIIGDKEKSVDAYQMMLNTSMGPGWYKEDQMGILNLFSKDEYKLTNAMAADYAAILEAASGEMTFQRYVQQEKNQFVETLVKCNSLHNALEYYKFETLPDNKIIISNAEDWRVDMPVRGQGYILGANQLIEASALRYLLSSAKDVSPMIRYAVSELHCDNDDNQRYVQDYSKLYGELLSQTVGKTHEALRLRMQEYVKNEFRDGYVPVIHEEDCQGEQLEEHVEDLLSVLQNHKSEIVAAQYSYWEEIKKWFDLFAYDQKDNIDQLAAIVKEHLVYMVRPSTDIRQKMMWMEKDPKDVDKNEDLIHFLIWHLLHPDRTVRHRAHESLIWLSEFDNRVVKCLMDTVINPCEIGLEVEAADLLAHIICGNPTLAGNYLNNHELCQKLTSVKNFSVSFDLYTIAAEMTKIDGDCYLWNIVSTIFPAELPDRGDVCISHKNMMFYIEPIIDKLNDLNVLGREFAVPYEEELSEMWRMGTIDNACRADAYIQRSFFLAYAEGNRYGRLMRNVMNKLLYGRVDKNRCEDVFWAINKYK